MYKKIKWITLSVIGYMLSPLSWWNDLFVNFPIAYAFAKLYWLICPDLILPFLILWYWFSNILWFMFIQWWIDDIINKQEKQKLLRNLLYTTIYTLLVFILVMKDIIVFPAEYLNYLY